MRKYILIAVFFVCCSFQGTRTVDELRAELKAAIKQDMMSAYISGYSDGLINGVKSQDNLRLIPSKFAEDTLRFHNYLIQQLDSK